MNQKIAVTGAEGAYAEIAAKKIFSRPFIIYTDSFEGVFDAVLKGLCVFGVLPFENSTAGIVKEVSNLLDKYSVSISKRIKLNVSHCLLVNPGAKMSDILEIHTHEQAAAQCIGFIEKYPSIKVVMCENTAFAAKNVSENKSLQKAAIASAAAADIYGLEILQRGLETNRNNETEFIVITAKQRRKQ